MSHETEDRAAPTTVDNEGDERSLLRATLPSLALAGGMLALERLRAGYQNRRMFAPTALDRGEAEPMAVDLPAQDQWFTAEDGVRLHGWWVPHRQPVTTILFCHGNTGNLACYLGVLRYLTRLRVSIFAFDYRGYGKSAGRPSETGLYRDAQAAWQHLTEGLGIDPDRILLLGHSLGGAVAIDLASQRPIPALVVQSSFTDMRSIARHLHSPAHLVAKNAFRSLEKVSSLEMPKLFIHGDNDSKIPHAMGRHLFETAAEPKSWYTVPGARHNDLHRVGRGAYLRTLRGFIGQVFG